MILMNMTNAAKTIEKTQKKVEKNRRNLAKAYSQCLLIAVSDETYFVLSVTKVYAGIFQALAPRPIFRVPKIKSRITLRDHAVQMNRTAIGAFIGWLYDQHSLNTVVNNKSTCCMASSTSNFLYLERTQPFDRTLP